MNDNLIGKFCICTYNTWITFKHVYRIIEIVADDGYVVEEHIMCNNKIHIMCSHITVDIKYVIMYDDLQTFEDYYNKINSIHYESEEHKIMILKTVQCFCEFMDKFNEVHKGDA